MFQSTPERADFTISQIAANMTRLETRTQSGATVEYWGYL